MKIQDLLQRANRKEPYNSNNAWGFGGIDGTMYYFDKNIKILSGTACYRHAKSHSYVKVYQKDSCIMSEISLNEKMLTILCGLIGIKE